ncbi:MAG: sulfate adenylyltransferase, partial [Oscillospiraceae bacterium]
DSFDIIVLRDRTAVRVRDKKITAVLPLSDYTYKGLPVVNGRGFEIKVTSQTEVDKFLGEYDSSSDAERSALFAKWVSFDTYRKVVFKA